MSQTDLPCDIAVVGLGILGVPQITHEAEEMMRRCRHIFVADTGNGVAEYLRTLSPHVVDLASEKETGAHRIPIYRRFASHVVSAALAEPPVCFATYGHPTMFCYPTTLIQRAAVVLDLKVALVPGVSSLDTLLCDLGVDPGSDGLQLYEATDLLVRQRPLQNDVACVITQAPMVADALNRPAARDVGNLALLQAYLLQFYPADCEVVLATSSPHPLLEPLIQQVRLGSLAAGLVQSAQLTTLFIPPVKRRAIADARLAQRMRVAGAEPVQTGAGAGSATPARPGRPAIGPQQPAS
jgi:uncharacterized protein YabN with tetrapyrrole methylase and pyrophosphatase domain